MYFIIYIIPHYIHYIYYILYIMYTQRTMYTYIYNVILDFFIFTLSIKLIYICRPELFISPNHLFNVFMSHKKLRNYSVLGCKIPHFLLNYPPSGPFQLSNLSIYQREMEQNFISSHVGNNFHFMFSCAKLW